MTRRINGKPETQVYIPELDRVYMSPKHAADALKGNLGAIYKCLTGERYTHRGYSYEWFVPDPQ